MNSCSPHRLDYERPIDLKLLFNRELKLPEEWCNFNPDHPLGRVLLKLSVSFYFCQSLFHFLIWGATLALTICFHCLCSTAQWDRYKSVLCFSLTLDRKAGNRGARHLCSDVSKVENQRLRHFSKKRQTKVESHISPSIFSWCLMGGVLFSP